MDIPLIRKFALGYVEGARYANPDIEIYRNMTGATPAAWNDPTRGGELARSQFDRGADVVYAAAGGTGIGVYQAARDAGKLAIGVDSNQNYLHPGTMLTSMVKRVDVAVYEAFRSARDGSWKGRHPYPRLAEDGVGWALDEYNRSLVSAEMEARDRTGAAGHRCRQDRRHRLHGAVAGGAAADRAAAGRPFPCPGSVRPRSKPSASTSGSARYTPTTASRWPSRRARSTASSARTAPASRP